jgi:curved DNA-binding protein CbpA
MQRMIGLILVFTLILVSSHSFAAKKFKNYYEVLGVARDATDQEIQNAFRAIAKKYHPDRNSTDPKAEEKFQEANEAYEVLDDHTKRIAFDRELASQSADEKTASRFTSALKFELSAVSRKLNFWSGANSADSGGGIVVLGGVKLESYFRLLGKRYAGFWGLSSLRWGVSVNRLLHLPTWQNVSRNASRNLKSVEPSP